VRLVLSYLMQPSHSPERTADTIVSVVLPALDAPTA